MPRITVFKNSALGAEPSFEANLDHISSVGVTHLNEIVEHRINRVFNTESHFLRFCNGGELRFAYSNDGKLLELSASRLMIKIEKGNRILFEASKTAPKQPLTTDHHNTARPDNL